MILDKPLLGKAYIGQTYLTSGMLYKDNSHILLELHNEGAEPKDDYLDQLDPSCIIRQDNGTTAIGIPRMKPCPETISFFTAPGEKSYLLTDCRLIHTDFTYGGGPYNYRQVIEVNKLIQISDYGLKRFGNQYLKINRMQSTIPELKTWVGNSALFFWMPDNNQKTIIAYGLRKTRPLKLGRIPAEDDFFARIQIQAKSSDNLIESKAELHSDTIFSTYSHKHLDINDHLRVHRAFLILLEIAYGRKLDMHNIQISRNDDKSLPNHSTVFHNLLTPHILTCNFEKNHNEHQVEPIFHFNDICKEGIHKWFDLLHNCPSGLYAFSNLIENEIFLPLEAQFLLVGVAIEHIGAMIMGKDGTFREQLNAVLDQLVPLLSDDDCKTSWAGGVTNSYNGIKHLHRANKLPDTVSMIEYLFEAKLMIRLWVAHHLGCNTISLSEYANRHSVQPSRIASVFRREIAHPS